MFKILNEKIYVLFSYLFYQTQTSKIRSLQLFVDYTWWFNDTDNAFPLQMCVEIITIYFTPLQVDVFKHKH